MYLPKQVDSDIEGFSFFHRKEKQTKCEFGARLFTVYGRAIIFRYL